MEMEDQDNHHNNQYGIDLRQFVSGRPTASSSHFPPLMLHPPPPPPPELFPGHRNLQVPPPGRHQHHYDLMMLMPRSGLHLHEFPGDSPPPVVTSATITNTNTTTTTTGHSVSGSTAVAASSSGLANALMGSGLEGEGGCFNAIGVGGGDIGGTGRWPRQETLTLLEIRSRLDSKFKEANQKGPLWEEVSRIMSEEHGYQRSGKKCREKFENLYKYYKKTKEGKAGRQDGKHYRFFRQLEALYGDTSNPNIAQETHFVGNASLGFHTAINAATQANNNQLEVFQSQKVCDSLSLSNSSEFDTTSSEENDLSTATLGENDSVEKRRKKRSGKSWKTKIKEFLDAQMRKLMERQEAWLERLTRTLEEKEKERLMKEEEWRRREAERVDREHRFWAKEREWIEARDATLMEALQKLNGREVNASSPEGVVGAHEVHNQSDHNQNEDGSEGIKTSVLKIKEGNKKRKEHSRSANYFPTNESMYHSAGGGGGYCEINGQSDGPSPGNSNAGNAVSDSCFRFLMSGTEGDNLWENYGLKLSKGDHQNQ